MTCSEAAGGELTPSPSRAKQRFTRLFCALTLLLATAPVLGIYGQGRFPVVKGAVFTAVFATIVTSGLEHAIGGTPITVSSHLFAILFLGAVVV
ncbi:MAG: hypothetical protein GY711_11970 [bacterium]|nr:hypothetical protein [bacterium]